MFSGDPVAGVGELDLQILQQLRSATEQNATESQAKKWKMPLEDLQKAVDSTVDHLFLVSNLFSTGTTSPSSAFLLSWLIS